MELHDGINLIYGENEAGKSTLHAFIQGMLFGIEKPRGRASKDDTYSKYQPWENPTVYGGTMDVEYRGRLYRVTRSFYKETKQYTVMDLATGREIPVVNQKGISFIEGLTQETYNNTVSIEQLKARTEKELAEEVRNHIANLTLSRNNQVNVGEATRYLTQKKKAIESNQTEKRLREVESQLFDIEMSMQEIELLSAQMQAVEEKLQQEAKAYQRDDIQRVESYISEYPRMKEKYIQYLRANGQKRQLEMLLYEKQKHFEMHQKKEKAGRKRKEKLTQKKNRVALMNSLVSIVIALAVVMGVVPVKPIYRHITMLLGAVLAFGWGAYFLINRFYYKGKKGSLLGDVPDEEDVSVVLNQVEEVDRIKRQIADLANILEEEGQEIQKYGSRIIDIPRIDEKIMNQLEAEVETLRGNIRRIKEESTQKKDNLRIEQERLRWKLESLAEQEGIFFEKEALKKELTKKLSEEEKEHKAIALAIDTINGISVNIHDEFSKTLNQQISQMIAKQTCGRYTDIKVDEKLNVKVGYEDRFVELEQLSVGTMEQIYLALRLCISNLLFPNEDMPLLFDDTFAYYDENRLQATLEVLGRESERQILLFTCHKREEEILKKCNLSYHKIVIE